MILFHDVDGCLNNVDGGPIGFSTANLSSENHKKLKRLGNLLDASPLDQLILNTGRIYEDTAYLIDVIGSRKARYVLVEHGAALWDAVQNRQISLEEIDHPGVTKIAETHIELKRISTLLTWYKDRGHLNLASAISTDASLQVEGNQQANLTISIPQDLDGEFVMAKLQELIASEPQFNNDSFHFHHSRPERFIDVMASVDKALGVDLALLHLDATNEQTFAIGNGLNDLPMLQHVATAICPANAEPEVRQFCQGNGILMKEQFIDATLTWLQSIS